MVRTIASNSGQRLERSCEGWIRSAPARGGVERSEAFFARHGYDPHRHDTYSIGMTVAGVQNFRYRGIAQCTVAGQAFVLHPDETHDGRAGTRDGFRYRTVYVDPGLISDALGHAGATLPFVRHPVSTDGRIAAAIAPAFDDLDRPLEELQQDQIVLALAAALATAETSIVRRPLAAHHCHAVRRTRAFLDARVQEGATSAELEEVAGLTRYAVARHFRACLGTSPYRYLMLRRLDRARDLIRSGTSLVDSALQSGFADQSHMTRQFKRPTGSRPDNGRPSRFRFDLPCRRRAMAAHRTILVRSVAHVHRPPAAAAVHARHRHSESPRRRRRLEQLQSRARLARL